MIVDTHWDSVLIADSVLPENLFMNITQAINSNNDFKIGEVGGCDASESSYLWSKESNFEFFEKWLLDSKLIPLLENHDIKISSSHHRMTSGGKMAWHCDGTYSIAATLYTTSCDGGELQVMSPCETKSILISPSPNRVVVIKCDNQHRVLEVKNGLRDTIQVFFTFIKRD